MSLTLYQINGQNVPPVADARLYDFLSSSALGIVEGCEVSSLGGNQLRVSSGWGIVYGRVFAVEEETITALTSTSGETQGRLLIRINVAAGAEPIEFITQAASTLPELTQEAINDDGVIYELPLAVYSVDELQITNMQIVFPKAKAASQTETIMPVGYIFHWSPVTGSGIDLSTAEKVAAHFGFGTWQNIADRMLVGAGGSYAAGDTGGAATHKLTVAQMPAHTHKVGYSGTSGSGLGYVDANNATSSGNKDTGSTGSGVAFDKMPPYYAVYIWQRIA